MHGEFEEWRWLGNHLDHEQLSQLLEIRRKVGGVLSNNVLPHFTDHSVKHCDRVINIIRNILSQNLALSGEEQITRDELFILALATLLHDIGMQVPKAHGIETPISELTAEELGVIRRDHGEVSGRILRDLVDGKEDIANLGISEYAVKRRLPHVACICEKHQSGAKYEPEEVSELSGKKIRIGLLIAVMRLADQLDCDFNRVDATKLSHFSIPVESNLHWIVCTYVDSVTIKKGYVDIWASFPDSGTGPQIDFISSLLVKKIQDEQRYAERTLYLNNIPVRVPDKISITKTDFTFTKPPLPANVVDIIAKKLTETNRPVHTQFAAIITRDNEADWMTHWRFVGNPFLDRPVAYGSGKFVETASLRQMLAELDSFLRGAEGELRLLTGDRGMGKTTLFQSIVTKFSDKYDVVIVDVADKVDQVHTAADLQKIIFYAIHSGTSRSPTGQSDDLFESARLGNKKVLCIDSLDRLPESKDQLVLDFFKGAQHILSRLRTVSVVIFACAKRWSRFLGSEELSYLGYRNQWNLSPFTSEDIAQLLDKRLTSSGQSFSSIFDHGCAPILRSLTNGNPRQVLEFAVSICRYGAEKRQTRITPQFIREQFEKEFDDALRRLLDKLMESKNFKEGMTAIYHYYLEMERRGLDTAEGWSQLAELAETGLSAPRIRGEYITPLKRVATPASNKAMHESMGPPNLKALPAVSTVFKDLKKEGYSSRGFLAFYSTDPIPPSKDDDDIDARIQSSLLTGPEIKHFDTARQLYVSVSRSKGPAFRVISDSWDCVEELLFAILFKGGAQSTNRLIAMKEEWLTTDHLGRQKFVPGAGLMRSEHAKLLTTSFMDLLRKHELWMHSLVSLFWIRDARGNVVRGRTEYLSSFGAKEMDLCQRHLNVVYKELVGMYELISSRTKIIKNQ